jgi:glycyl-tRNA synthetase beta chain
MVRTTPNFEPLAVSFKRIRNILEKAGGVDQYATKQISKPLLEPGAEQDLFLAFEDRAAVATKLKLKGDYYSALVNIAEIRPKVDKFFDDVLVMAKDDRVRENRLAFLAQLLQELSVVADFSEIVTEG